MLLSKLFVEIDARDKATRVLNDIEDSGKSLTRTFSRIGSATAGVGIAAGAIAGVSVGLGKAAQRGDEYLGVVDAFNGATGDQFLAIEKLRGSTRGLVSDYDLMTRFSTANRLGAVHTAREYATLGRAADALGRSVGRGSVESLNDLTVGLARQSPKILDNLGVVIDLADAHDIYAKSVGKTAEQLTAAERSVAFHEEAMRTLKTAIDELGVPEDNAGTIVSQLVVDMKNLREEAALMAAESDGFRDFLRGLREDIASVRGLNLELEEAKEAMAAMDKIELAALQVAIPAQMRELRTAISDFDQLFEVAGSGALHLQETLEAKYEGLVEQLRLAGQLLEDIAADEARSRASALQKAQEAQRKKEEEQLRRIEGIYQTLNQKLATTGGLYDLIGDEVDVVKENTSAYTAAIRALLSEGVNPADKRLQDLLARLSEVPAAFTIARFEAGELEKELKKLGLSIPSEATMAPITTPIRDPFEKIDAPSAADGFYVVADAISVVDGEAAQLLGTVGDLVQGFGAIKSNDPFESLSGFGLLLGGGLSLIQSVTGDDPATRALTEAMDRNVAQMSRLTDGIARLDSSALGVDGGSFGGVRDAIQEFFRRDFNASDELQGRTLERFERRLEALGLTMEDADEVADSLGLSIENTAASLAVLANSLEQNFIAQIFDSFDGLQRLTRQRLEVFDITDPAEQIEEIRKAVEPFLKGDLARDFKNLDFANPDEFIRTLLKELEDGVFDLSQLDGLSVDNLIDVLVELETLGDAAQNAADNLNQIASLNLSSVFRVDRARHLASAAAVAGFDPGALPPTDTQYPGSPTGGITITGDVTVVANDPEEFEKKLQRRRTRGGIEVSVGGDRF